MCLECVSAGVFIWLFLGAGLSIINYSEFIRIHNRYYKKLKKDIQHSYDYKSLVVI
jgi:hypothetical protein